MLPVETNIVIFGLKQPWTSASFVGKLKGYGILGHPISPTQVRLVTHLDVSEAMVEKTIEVINKL
jgi:threonine aldolase